MALNLYGDRTPGREKVLIESIARADRLLAVAAKIGEDRARERFGTDGVALLREIREAYERELNAIRAK